MEVSVKNYGSKRFVKHYLMLRRLVAFLGEKNQYSWWSTTALNATGAKYHAMLFPRTSGLSTLAQVSQSARNHHDQSISSSHSFHLFRLPNELEESLFRSAAEAPAVADLSKEKALNELELLAGQKEYDADGPVQIGNLSQIRSPKSIEAIAGYYLRAFRSGKTIIPFFADA